MKIKQKKARKILNSVIKNTLIPLEAIMVLSDELKRNFLMPFYSKESITSLYSFILDKRRQDYILDFLYEVYYQMLCFDISIDSLKDSVNITKEFIESNHLSKDLQNMITPDAEYDVKDDILMLVLFFLRLYNNILDEELIARRHHDEALNISNT